MIQPTSKRNGKVIVLVALMLPVLAGMLAFAIDVGYIGLARSRLQAAADAAALAAVEKLPNSGSAVSVAQSMGQLNYADSSNIIAANDVEFGTWDKAGQSFSVTAASSANAVRVTARRSSQNGNALRLFFGSVLGVLQSNVDASAVAIRPTGGIGTRFLIDDEMIDKDVTAIEDLADDLGVDVEELVTPRGFNDNKDYGDSDWTWEDNFLDIPAGETLELPTGQGTDYDNNDAGLFDIDHPEFPFSDDESFREFLFYSETGNDSSKWGTDYDHILDQLDPLEGVAPVTDDSIYDSFVNPDFIHVSPITYSDVSTLNMEGGVPQINAKGLRRGLLAFKIIAVGDDEDGGGSVLPNLIIEVVDPSTISLDDVRHFSAAGGGGSIQLVQ